MNGCKGDTECSLIQSEQAIARGGEHPYLEARDHPIHGVIIPGMQGCLGLPKAQYGHNVQHCLCCQLIDLRSLCIGRFAQPKKKLGQRSGHYASQKVVASQQQRPASRKVAEKEGVFGR